MAKTIKIPYKGETYTLEYTRESVKDAEARGFRVNEISSMPATYIPMLFDGAFMAHHPRVKKSLLNEMWDEVQDKFKLVEMLAEMYNETLEALMDSPKEAEGNVIWEANW